MGKRKRKSRLPKLTIEQIVFLIGVLITGGCTIVAAILGGPIVEDFLSSLSTKTNNTIKVGSINVDENICFAPMFAVPQSISIPPKAKGNDPFERYNDTKNFLRDAGIPIATKSIDTSGISFTEEDLRRFLSPCDPSLSIDIPLWNNSPNRILVKEFTLIVESYDYEPSGIPDDYKLVFIVPPQLGGPGPDSGYAPTPLPNKFFKGELKSTSNSLPFLRMSNTPPIIIEPNSPINFSIYLNPVSTGTFRIHLSFYIEDNQGNQTTLDSTSFISKWVLIDNLKASQTIGIDVK